MASNGSVAVGFWWWWNRGKVAVINFKNDTGKTAKTCICADLCRRRVDWIWACVWGASWNSVENELFHINIANCAWLSSGRAWQTRSPRQTSTASTPCGQKNANNCTSKNSVCIHLSIANKSQTQAGQKAVYLHGCVGCTKIWGQGDDNDVCELCGSNRFDEHGKAREFVVHFPLIDRFKSLLRCPQYCDSVRWECKRPQGNGDYISGTQFGDYI